MEGWGDGGGMGKERERDVRGLYDVALSHPWKLFILWKDATLGSLPFSLAQWRRPEPPPFSQAGLACSDSSSCSLGLESNWALSTMVRPRKSHWTWQRHLSTWVHREFLTLFLFSLSIYLFLSSSHLLEGLTTTIVCSDLCPRNGHCRTHT